MKRSVLVALVSFCLLLPVACNKKTDTQLSAQKQDQSLERVQNAGDLLWGADVVGGIPYVYEDPNHPGTYIGFEKDIADAIGKQLGVQTRLVIKAWDTLIPELQRGSFDMAMNGIENTEDRAKIVLYSEPYFVYAQQLTIRKETQGIGGLSDLTGRKVATLSGTAAEDILRGTSGIQVVTNPEIIYSYRELETGQVDAVLLDTPIAAAYGAANPKLRNVGESFGRGHYVIAFRHEDRALRDAVDQAITKLKSDGELRLILTKWGIMDGHQEEITVQ